MCVKCLQDLKMERVQSVLCSGNVNIKQWQILDRVGDRTATSRSLHSSCPGRTIFLSSVPLLPSCLYSLFLSHRSPSTALHWSQVLSHSPEAPSSLFFLFYRKKKNIAYPFRPHPLSFNLFLSSFLNQPWRDMVKLTSRTERERSLRVSVWQPHLKLKVKEILWILGRE